MWAYNCKATGCTTQAAFSCNGVMVNCVATGNTSHGFYSPGTLSNCAFINCLSYNNTGATTDGFHFASGVNNTCINCTSYGNGRDGFRLATNGSFVANSIAESNTGIGFYSGGSATAGRYYNNATYGNGTAFNLAAGNVNTGNISGSSSFFTNAAGADFSLNNDATGGALLRGSGLPGPPEGGTSHPDVGAFQHQGASTTGHGSS